MKTKRWLGALLMACTMADAAAQQAVRDTARLVEIEEVVVVATPKEHARLRQQPVSSTSFSQQDMRQKNVTSIKSVSALVPNLFIPSYGSKLTTSAYIRGVGSRINTPAVGLYVDNIPYVNKNSFDFNFWDVERIDVMRGPQGTLYGYNTMGGLIRVFSKSPFTYQGTDLKLGAATYGDFKASATHYHRISDKFAFSGGVFYQHTGGFFKNAARGNERVDKGDELGSRLRAIYLPSENTKLDFTIGYEYLRQGGYPYEAVSIGYIGDAGDVGRVAYNSRSGYKRNLLNVGLNIEHQADGVVFNSITGYQYLADHMDLDQDFTRSNIYTMMQKQRSSVLTQEFILKSKADRRWQWLVGASASYQWLKTEAPVTFHDEGLAWLNNTMNTAANAYLPSVTLGSMTMDFDFSDIIGGTDLAFPGTYKTPEWNMALFHQSTFNDLLGLRGLSLTAGLRLDYQAIRLDYNASTSFGHTYGLSGVLTTPRGEQTITMIPATEFAGREVAYQGKLHNHFLQLLPKVALKYDIDARNNVYVTVARGFRAGGYNIQMFSDLLETAMQQRIMTDVADVTVPVVESLRMLPDDTKAQIVSVLQGMASSAEPDIEAATLYKPEWSWNYELGGHFTLPGNALRVDAAVFYMDIRDQQISRFSEQGFGRITVNAGKSKSMGAELSAEASLSPSLSLFGNYGYTYAVFRDYVTSDSSGNTLDYTGNYVPFVPKHTFALGGRYVLRLPEGSLVDDITFSPVLTGAGRIYWTEENNASQGFYAVLNGRLGVRRGGVCVDLWVNNALNRRYQVFYFESMGNAFRQRSNPLQAGIDLRLSF